MLYRLVCVALYALLSISCGNDNTEDDSSDIPQNEDSEEQVNNSDDLVEQVPDENCGEILHGQTTERTRFATAAVPFDGACLSETQTGTCNKGTLFWTGEYSQESCVVLPNEAPSMPEIVSISGLDGEMEITDIYVTGTTLVCDALGAEDLDGGSISYSYEFTNITGIPSENTYIILEADEGNEISSTSNISALRKAFEE